MPRLARENTLPSFALAIDAGADGIELDVHGTRDGVVVVHHDPDADDGLPIADTLFAALRASAHQAAAIPMLLEVCELVQGRAELFVEVKGAGIERLVIEVMSGYTGQFAIHSFDHALIARVHALDPTLRLGVLFEQMPDDVEALMAVTGARDVWPHAPLVTSRLVDTVRGAGGRTIAWTVNDETTAARLATAGVDGLCGDDVRLLRGS